MTKFKRSIAILAAAVMVFAAIGLTAFAAWGSPEYWSLVTNGRETSQPAEIPSERQALRLVDGADVLDAAEEEQVLQKLDQISARQNFDIVIVTQNGLEGASITEFADDYYDYNGFGYGTEADGCILVLDMDQRDYWISTTGCGITALTDVGIEYIADLFVASLSSGHYADGFEIYADQVDAFVTQAKNGDPYDVDNIPKSYNPSIAVGGFIVGIIAALTGGRSMKSKMKTVRHAQSASNYTSRDKIHITKQQDLFLNRMVSQHRIERSSGGGGHGGGGSTVHTSSSGRSHGGGGGKF